MAKPKIRIDAREVLRDLRSGMDDQELMTKFSLSYRQLQRLFRKLILADLISPLELASRLCVTESQITETLDGVAKVAKDLDDL
ncbi:MAG: hypothetical protein HY914_15895 [Desulfomonile tiedjei]|nr:hypothetical protein [Desulfomonile tiedjei]